MAITLGAPGADGDRGLSGRGPPVDRAGVVTRDVLAEAVELGALTAGQHAGAAVQFAEAGQAGGQVLAAGEGRQDTDGPGDLVVALPGGEAQGAVRADGDPFGSAVAAAGGAQARGETAALAGWGP